MQQCHFVQLRCLGSKFCNGDPLSERPLLYMHELQSKMNVKVVVARSQPWRLRTCGPELRVRPVASPLLAGVSTEGLECVYLDLDLIVLGCQIRQCFVAR